MKLLIEIPTWLGDSVMASPAIESLVKYYDNPSITIIGSKLSTEVFRHHPNVNEIIILNRNYFDLFKCIKGLKKIDIFFSFRSSYRSRFIKFFIDSEKKYQFNIKRYKNSHLVEQYHNFVNNCLGIDTNASRLSIYKNNTFSLEDFNLNSDKRLLGINPGASYGDAKQWSPDRFADVAIELSKKYDIIIFGTNNEIKLSLHIEKILKKRKVFNFHNLAGKTNISELQNIISILDLFITGDSGPMHLAAAFQIPTVSIFGPTRHNETSQWRNEKSIIVKKNLECQPCMKRTCPLKHHNCMNLISSGDVIEAAHNLG